jgi:hypothetical protein
MLPPLLGLPYHQECSDVPRADEIRKAFYYQCTEEGEQEACAAFVALFGQQACRICPTRKDPGLARGWPEDLEIAAGQFYAKWDTLITNNRVCREHEDACTLDEEFVRPNFLEATAMEFLQKEEGALLQDCEDTREDVLQADESATEEAAEPTLPQQLRKIALSCTKQQSCPRWCSQMLECWMGEEGAAGARRG